MGWASSGRWERGSVGSNGDGYRSRAGLLHRRLRGGLGRKVHGEYLRSVAVVAPRSPLGRHRSIVGTGKVNKQNTKRAWIIAMLAAPVVVIGLGRLIAPEHNDALLVGGLAVVTVILVIAAVGMVRERRNGK
jgi:hypothetical protein